MSGTDEQIEWYLARDGQQFGPLSEAELRKIIDLGHLRPADLLWKAGMEDWQEAENLFPDAGKAAAPEAEASPTAATSQKPAAAAAASDEKAASKTEAKSDADAKKLEPGAGAEAEKQPADKPAAKTSMGLAARLKADAAEEDFKRKIEQAWAKKATEIEAEPDESDAAAPAAAGEPVKEAAVDATAGSAAPSAFASQTDEPAAATNQNETASAPAKPTVIADQKAGSSTDLERRGKTGQPAAAGISAAAAEQARRLISQGRAPAAGPDKAGTDKAALGQADAHTLPPGAEPPHPGHANPADPGNGVPRTGTSQTGTAQGRQLPQTPAHLAPQGPAATYHGQPAPQYGQASQGAVSGRPNRAQPGQPYPGQPYAAPRQPGQPQSGLRHPGQAPYQQPVPPRSPRPAATGADDPGGLPPAAIAAEAGKPRKSGGGRRAIGLIAVLAMIGGGGWAAMTRGDAIVAKAKDLLQAFNNETRTAVSANNGGGDSKRVTVSSAPAESGAKPQKIALATPDEPKQAVIAPPVATTAANPLQVSPVWRYVSSAFPEWYKSRAAEAAGIRSTMPDDEAVVLSMSLHIMALRRKHANSALSSSQESLRAIATNFLATVKVLAKESTEACYGFISHGEFAPPVSKLRKLPAVSDQIDQQNLAIFKAVTDGQGKPQTYSPPQPVDYRALGAELISRGWTTQDLQLFTDPVALSSAKPERVCKMVQDWFSAQLALPNSDAQIRLLVQSLRPVVAG